MIDRNVLTEGDVTIFSANFKKCSDLIEAHDPSRARDAEVPPPGRTPSSPAARVALSGIFDAILLLLHLDLGRAAGADEFNQLRETDGPP
jgi:hypothetical protein